MGSSLGSESDDSLESMEEEDEEVGFYFQAISG